MEKSVPVIIPQRVKEQIQYLCSKIWEVEWSGVLLYNTEGELGEEDFKVTLEYIYLMNKGTATYTEFETDASIVSFLMKNPQYFDCKQALIHSHNNMSVFFSGTDLDELYTNSAQHNYYLSVIVNNKHEICAKIAQKGKSKDNISRVITYNTLSGEKTKTVTEYKENDVIFVYSCGIISEVQFTDTDFIKRTEEIIKIADEKQKKIESTRTYPNYIPRFPKENAYQKFMDWEDVGIATSKSFEEEFIMPDETINEDLFAAKWILLDEDYKGTLESALKKVEKDLKKVGPEDIDIYTETLENNFSQYYHNYYDDVNEESWNYTLLIVQALLAKYYDKYDIASEIDTSCSLLIKTAV